MFQLFHLSKLIVHKVNVSGILSVHDCLITGTVVFTKVALERVVNHWYCKLSLESNRYNICVLILAVMKLPNGSCI